MKLLEEGMEQLMQDALVALDKFEETGERQLFIDWINRYESANEENYTIPKKGREKDERLCKRTGEKV